MESIFPISFVCFENELLVTVYKINFSYLKCGLSLKNSLFFYIGNLLFFYYNFIYLNYFFLDFLEIFN